MVGDVESILWFVGESVTIEMELEEKCSEKIVNRKLYKYIIIYNYIEYTEQKSVSLLKSLHRLALEAHTENTLQCNISLTHRCRQWVH